MYLEKLDVYNTCLYFFEDDSPLGYLANYAAGGLLSRRSCLRSPHPTAGPLRSLTARL